ncbi:hypothetical protein CEXT_383231 [Caerostris extrusa]|uniref:Uncharacterized protein n=1 Tax=Caerostris extrusa TaxID=172846 RepID=A0AAV4NRY3_CAEEX|nr:hypothetical protein CEXT_383231 [Caerostris extrusa]
MPLKSILSVQVFRDVIIARVALFRCSSWDSFFMTKTRPKRVYFHSAAPSASTILSLLLNFFPSPLASQTLKTSLESATITWRQKQTLAIKIALFNVHLVRVEDNKANNSCLKG